MQRVVASDAGEEEQKGSVFLFSARKLASSGMEQNNKSNINVDMKERQDLNICHLLNFGVSYFLWDVKSLRV